MVGLLVYDWLLCFSQEVEYVWNWHSGVTIPSLLYMLGRYSTLVMIFLDVRTINQMSDLVRYLATAFNFDVSLIQI